MTNNERVPAGTADMLADAELFVDIEALLLGLQHSFKPGDRRTEQIVALRNSPRYLRAAAQCIAPEQPVADAPAAEQDATQQRLDDLAEQLRTLQQDVAALKQQGGELREGEPCLDEYRTLEDLLTAGLLTAETVLEGQGSNPMRWWVSVNDAGDRRFTQKFGCTMHAGDLASQRFRVILPQPAAPGVSK